MPGCTLLQVISRSSTPRTSCLQRIENTGLKSFRSRSAAEAAARAGAPEVALSKSADLAWHGSAISEERRYLEWIEIGLPRTGSGALLRLPFNEAVKLAALVGSGRMTWLEINTALDAMIKLATAHALDQQATWEGTTQEDEAGIWARYHARCDELFARDAEHSDAGSWSRDRLWSRERTLDRLRNARDRELAALRRRPPSVVIRLKPSQGSTAQLTPLESDALEKLNTSGFIGSEGMIAAIAGLVGETAGGFGGNAQDCS